MGRIVAGKFGGGFVCKDHGRTGGLEKWGVAVINSGGASSARGIPRTYDQSTTKTTRNPKSSKSVPGPIKQARADDKRYSFGARHDPPRRTWYTAVERFLAE